MTNNRNSTERLGDGYSQAFIQKIQDAIDFVELVNRYTTLKKRGKQYLGLCPFHSENTPSFSVDPSRGLYHCFGCGKGGNIFSFLMEKESISFPEAVEQLAKEAGIPLPRRRDSSFRGDFLDELYKANEFACMVFQGYLDKPLGEKVFAYFDQRGLNRDTIKAFSVGYAPPRWDSLSNAVSRDKMAIEPFLKVGLLRKKDMGGFYDAFRGRIIFPIIGTGKRVLGFAGREFDDLKSEVKYVNSPESPVYQKSRIIYGIWLTREYIRQKETVILVEGYTDLMALWQANIRNVAASCGTAFTEHQASFLHRYANQAITLFDGDEAGINATMRTIPILLDAGFDVKCSILPAGEDPASYIQNKGTDEIHQLLEQAPSWFDMLFSKISEKINPDTPENKIKIAETISEYLAHISDPLKLRVYIHKLASMLIIPDNLIIDKVNNMKRRTRNTSNIKDISRTEDHGKFKFTPQQRTELEFCAILLHDNNYLKNIDKKQYFDIFIDYPGIFDNLVVIYEKTGKVGFNDLCSSLQDTEIRGFIAESLFKFKDMGVKNHFEGLLAKLMESRVKRSIQKLSNQLRECEQKQDKEKAEKLTLELMNLYKQRKEITDGRGE
ncbi:DNA primase [bacterium]|nr:DNA primase [bacterium]